MVNTSVKVTPDREEEYYRTRLRSIPRSLGRHLKIVLGVSDESAATLVRDGHIKVERQRSCCAHCGVGRPDDLIFPDEDTVCKDGAPLRERPTCSNEHAWCPDESNPIVCALDKPSGMKMDVKNCPILRGILEEDFFHSCPAAVDTALSPVGQLDVGTTGILLFTNSGDLGRMLCLPGQVPKVYLATYHTVGQQRPNITQEETSPPLPQPPEFNPVLEQLLLSHDLDNDGFLVGFDAAEIVSVTQIPLSARAPAGVAPKLAVTVRVTIRSGKNHVVKKLFQKAGLCVRALRRESVGPVGLETCSASGRLCALSEEAVAELWRACGGARRMYELKAAHLRCRWRWLANAENTRSCSPGCDCERVKLGSFLADLMEEVPGEEEDCFARFPGLRCDHSSGRGSLGCSVSGGRDELSGDGASKRLGGS